VYDGTVASHACIVIISDLHAVLITAVLQSRVGDFPGLFQLLAMFIGFIYGDETGWQEIG
jgi:hypothetical protein